MELNKSKAQAEMLALFLCPKEVNAMPYILKDQIAAAREMDLMTYPHTGTDQGAERLQYHELPADGPRPHDH